VLVVTVDIPVMGNRENNLRPGFPIPIPILIRPGLRLARKRCSQSTAAQGMFRKAVGRVTIGKSDEGSGEPVVGIDATELVVLDELGDHRPVVAAQLSPPSSDPAKSAFLRFEAITRSFCPSRAGVGSSLPMAPIFPPQGFGASRRRMGSSQ